MLRDIVGECRWLVLAVLLVTIASATITSCGSGDGSSNGGLCEQCGDSDGPCQATACIVAGAEPADCADSRKLICRRQVDSAQQRCYPANQAGTDVEVGFKCDGSPPQATLHPATVTPTPTPTPTSTAATPTEAAPTGSASGVPTPTPTSTPDDSEFCGNNVVDGEEECDGTNLDENDCSNLCEDEGGTLRCVDCRFDFTGCTAPPCAP